MKNNIRGYIFSRPFMDERVPQHVQNLVIRDYCEKQQLNYLLSATEYAMENCFLILNQVLNEIDEVDGIAAYSLFQMPNNFTERKDIYSKILSRKKTLHFAVEGLNISKEEDIERIESIWKIKNVLPNFKQNLEIEIKNKGQLRNFVTSLHLQTKRDVLARMNDDKVNCMHIAKKYGQEYWDGDRRFGYGGYKYIPGRWKSVAQGLIETYQLKAGSKILDVGCGKGFLLYEMLLIEPGLQIKGFDVSEYGIQCAPDDIRKNLFIHNAKNPFPFDNNEFDLVISLTTLHNLNYINVKKALNEIERVSKKSYLTVESYRNELELFNLQCWALTCETFFEIQEWMELFADVGFSGDYEFIYFS